MANKTWIDPAARKRKTDMELKEEAIKRVMQWRKDNPDRTAEYASLPKILQMKRVNSTRWRRLNPEKYAAQIENAKKKRRAKHYLAEICDDIGLEKLTEWAIQND